MPWCSNGRARIAGQILSPAPVKYQNCAFNLFINETVELEHRLYDKKWNTMNRPSNIQDMEYFFI